MKQQEKEEGVQGSREESLKGWSKKKEDEANVTEKESERLSFAANEVDQSWEPW